MSNRTLVIFSIFVVVGFVGMIFLYFYSSVTDNLINDYVERITNCSNITIEEECRSNRFCEGIYQPSCSDCLDLVFDKCQEIPEIVLVQREVEKRLCEETGGQWGINKVGTYCLCERTEVNKIFDKNRGCIDR